MKFSRTQLLIGIIALIVFAGVLGWYINQTFLKPSEPFVVVLPILDIPPTRPITEGFVDKMEEFGYKEGVDVVYRRNDYIPPGPEGFEQLRNLYRSYVAEGVDLIQPVFNIDTKIAMEETEAAGKPIPIIAGDMFDPVSLGLVKSWRSSGNNLTGVAENRNDVIEKGLDLFTTVVPGVKTIGVGAEGLMVPDEPAIGYLKTLRDQAEKLGIEIVEYTTDVPPGPGHTEAVIRVFSNIKQGEIDAWAHIPGHFFANQQAFEHQMALRIKIPHMLPAIELDDDGSVINIGEHVGLFTYGTDFYKKGQQLAVLADKILRGGASPSEIPLELPLKYSIMVNLKTAEAIGVTIPPEILDIADTIVK